MTENKVMPSYLNAFSQLFVWKTLYFDPNQPEPYLQRVINNKPPLTQMMAWHRKGDKPLSDAIIRSFEFIYA